MKITQVYIGVGSNIDKLKNIDGCLANLKKYFRKLDVSPIYQSKAIGMEGEDFYNLVVKFETSLSLEDVELKLREIEYNFGRKRNQIPHSPRTLDIDLLLYGDFISKKNNIPRDDITKYSFVLKPLYELEPNLIHPVESIKISALWEKFDTTKQPLKHVTETFHKYTESNV